MWAGSAPSSGGRDGWVGSGAGGGESLGLDLRSREFPPGYERKAVSYGVASTCDFSVLSAITCSLQLIIKSILENTDLVAVLRLVEAARSSVDGSDLMWRLSSHSPRFRVTQARLARLRSPRSAARATQDSLRVAAPDGPLPGSWLPSCAFITTTVRKHHPL